jgi:hypothetical protein
MLLALLNKNRNLAAKTITLKSITAVYVFGAMERIGGEYGDERVVRKLSIPKP